ncbi:MAG: hypothetical protein E4H28_01675 [Gemmatimonadales bacterium]|nr:MAG: hypothetical protein E4H28_01675 [Gemmatimonadales bacterium]
MSFLHPWALALAALAATPILLHLLRRDVVQRIPFPALRYLRRAEQRTARTMRLRDQLLLAIRVLLVILLAAAAARPLAGRGGAKDHEPTDGLLIIDNTASMSRVREGRTLLDHQLEAARDALEMAGPADRFWVAPMVGTVLVAGVPAEAAVSALDSIQITDAGGDIVDRLVEMTTAVPVRQDRVREAHVYTDGQASALHGGPLDLSAWGPVVIAISSDDMVTNGMVTSLRLEPDGAVVPGDPTAVAARIDRRMSGDESEAAPDTVDVRLIVDGQTAAMSRAAWGSEAILALPDLSAGPHTIRVEAPPSGLRSDDGRQIGLVAAENPVVRLAGDPSGFAGKALQTLWIDGRIRSETDGAAATIELVEGTSQPAGPHDVTLVLIPPPDLTDLPAFQQRLDALDIPWRLAVQASSGAIALNDPPDVAGLAEVRISAAYSLERQAAPTTPVDSVLIRTADDAPWLVRGSTGSRVFLLLASPLHPEASDLPTGVAMIPFLEHVLLRWSRPGQEPTWSTVAGHPVTMPARAEFIVSPDGDTIAVEGGAPWTPRHAGNWTIRSAAADNPVDLRLGVNVPAAESDIRPASNADLEAALAGSQIETVERPGDWPGAVFIARRGAEATPWLLGAVLLLVLAEVIVAAPERIARQT